MADSRDITGKNRKFKGTDSITLPKGTEAQRVGSESGELRFNTDTNLAEYYDGVGWKPIDSPPVITSFTLDGGSSVTSASIDDEAAGVATLVIAGTSFDTTAGVVTFVPETTGSTINTQSITRTSANEFTVTVTRGDFNETDGPYTLRLANGSGLAATLTSAITADDTAPAFNESAGNLGSAFNTISATFDGGATDPDGQTVTHSISAGSLPSGLSINSGTGSITGTPSGNDAGDYTFTVSAATDSLTTTREFTITIASLPSGGSISTYGNYRAHTFTSSGTFVNSVASLSVDMLLVAGGGSGGVDNGGGGGAGGMLEPTGISLTAQSYGITVGGGGASRAGGNDDGPGSPGGNSTGLGYTAVGGGAGPGWTGANAGAVLNGGSGGGQSSSGSGVGPGPGSGTSGQGNNGGSAVNGYSGGGGGKGSAGSNGTGGIAGRGGSQGNNAFRTGSNIGYAGGGTGGWDNASGLNSSGHSNNNGVTKATGQGQESDCAANTGHGGHGANHNDNRSGGGGSGICVIRYDLTAI